MAGKKRTLLAMAAALVAVAAGASAGDWGYSGSWNSQAGYVSRDDGYGGQYADRDHYDRHGGYQTYNRGYDGERARSYDWNRTYDGGRYQSYDWNRGYDNGYQDRGYRSYGEHRDRDESDDD